MSLLVVLPPAVEDSRFLEVKKTEILKRLYPAFERFKQNLFFQLTGCPFLVQDMMTAESGGTVAAQ